MPFMSTRSRSSFLLFLIALLTIGSVQAQEDSLEFNPEKGEGEKVYMSVEEDPTFPGGDSEMMKYIQEELEYPEQAQKEGVTGTVIVSHIVEKDGSLTNIQVVKGIGAGCDEEAKQVVKSMPKWDPGKQRGKPVRVNVKIPIRYKLNDDSSSDQEGGHETKE